MNILTQSIVSNSDMIKNYKSCREKAESLGKIIIMKNNQPDAVLFSISEYERLSVFIEHLEGLEGQDVEKVAESLTKEGKLKRYSADELIDTIK
ncbi:MAG: Antitoxin [Neobacillus sp.]|jgi:prevent-host-death family protein|nr:Antitoxin [Neobacillus sp.]